MKKILLVVFGAFVAQLSFGQIKIQSEVDFEKEGNRKEIFVKKFISKKNKNTQNAADSQFYKAFQEPISKLEYNLFGDIETQGIILLNFFINESGEFDTVLYRVEGTITDGLEVQPNPKLVNNFLDSMMVLLKNTKYQGVSPAITSWLTSIGDRTIKSGKNTIISLAELANSNQLDTVKTIAFNQLKLKAIPELFYKCVNVEHIDLSQNEFIEAQLDLSKFPKLKELNLKNNQITAFDFGTQPSNVEVITLSQNQLEAVDIDLSVHRNLKNLTLTGNKLKDGSLHFSKNSTLKVLNLQENLLTDIPASIKENIGLEGLWLGGNLLINLNDESFEGLKNLKDLNLYKCGLKSVPENISKLKNLEILDLYYNQLTELPASLRKLKKLQQLAIAHNQLTALPNRIGRKKYLHTIYAHHNRISALPKSLKRVKNLRLLDLNHNWIAEFPAVISSFKKLEELEISNNNLTELSFGITKMKGLRKLFINNNPFTQGVSISKNSDILQQLENKNTEVFK